MSVGCNCEKGPLVRPARSDEMCSTCGVLDAEGTMVRAHLTLQFGGQLVSVCRGCFNRMVQRAVRIAGVYVRRV